MFVRNLGHNGRGRVRPCAEIAAVTGNIRRGVAAGNLADCLCKRQTGYKLEQTDYDKVSYPFVLLGCDLGTEINPILYTKKEWTQSSWKSPWLRKLKR